VAQLAAEFLEIGAALVALEDGRIEQAEGKTIERLAGVEDALEVTHGRAALGTLGVLHQHLGIAHDRRYRRAQFLPHVGNQRALGTAAGVGSGYVARDTLSSKATILPSSRGSSTGLVS